MREDARLAFPVDRLPPELSAEDAAEFLEICARIQEGLADIEAGKVLDEDEAFAEIQRMIDGKAE
ncbi:hypothetical protein JL100_003915 [Skermanella mucosa]|uniref:hypothetical protein n=1 Tax=Skermanella mucosa TaxID=1789672 RepID=UPI00192AC579|nr:hypothetical protein [Skermanella mucosa]UEM21921.1 hypothetical protein JL100_003915 [Skermanella mucosa]